MLIFLNNIGGKQLGIMTEWKERLRCIYTASKHDDENDSSQNYLL